MIPLQQAIEETAALGKKLQTENPTLMDVSFKLSDFPLDEVQNAAMVYGKTAEFEKGTSRFRFCLSIYGAEFNTVFIHITSVEVKAKLVYE